MSSLCGRGGLLRPTPLLAVCSLSESGFSGRLKDCPTLKAGIPCPDRALLLSRAAKTRYLVLECSKIPVPVRRNSQADTRPSRAIAEKPLPIV